MNEKICEISWYTKEELIWKPHSIVRHSDMPKEIFIDLWNTIKIQKKIWKWIIKNKKKDWSPYWVQSFISPILDKNWNILEFISVRTDITDLILLKDKLEQSLGILKELDQKKDDFLILIWLLKEMKWDLEVKSSLNKWSEFLFYLPL